MSALLNHADQPWDEAVRAIVLEVNKGGEK